VGSSSGGYSLMSVHARDAPSVHRVRSSSRARVTARLPAVRA
jgi:hypothetical protein